MTEKEIIMLKKTMTKKAFKEHQKGKRVFALMNTGTRTHKSDKDYSRSRNTREFLQMTYN